MAITRALVKLSRCALSLVVASALVSAAAPIAAYAQGDSLVAAALGDRRVAVLTADGCLYAGTETGERTGVLVGSVDSNDVAAALADVGTLVIGSDVKGVEGDVLVAVASGSGEDVTAVDAKLSQLVNVQKVTFLTSKSANSAAVKTAKNSVSSATKAKKMADSKVKAAKAKHAALSSLWKKRATLKKQGSLGYFQYYAQVFGDKGAKAAIKALKRQGYSTTDSFGKKFAGFTHFGRSGDATSLANFERAVKWIPRGNTLRVKDNHFKGSKALKVSDVVMAMSQSHANWSNSHLNHAGMCGSNYPVGENLAWNYGSDPYYQWYTEEKAAYEGKANGQTGHYLNLVNASYLGTGLAVCTYGSMYGWTTFCQQFSCAPVAGEKLYTVAQYKKRIAAYKKFLKNGASQVKAAKKARDSAIATQKGATAALKAANNALAIQQNCAVNACETIGAKAFYGLGSLSTVVNFDKTLVSSIGSEAFGNCVSLGSMAMPYATLKSVGSAAFSGSKLSVTPSVSVASVVSVGAIKTQKFKPGKAAMPSPVVKQGKTKLTKGAHYTLRYAGNYIKGTASVTVVGAGKYYGSKTVKFKIA